MRLVILFLVSALMGSQLGEGSATKAIGYIGFDKGKLWAIQFNDCTVYDFEGAEKYLWFDRSLDSISCYKYKEADKSFLRNSPILIYDAPDFDAEKHAIDSFSEFSVSKSGWGSFPKVYSKSGDCWFRVKEGWVYLSSSDRKFVRFYQGEQDRAAQAKHDTYFNTH
ncbi:hypothetical protein [Microbulbifer discodermiae]|uniref:hypothetical protein n=1 Tax=Microbulbifer sp. 2201CG32-9 TaxID=3232309 RepID=UPI00345BB958